MKKSDLWNRCAVCGRFINYDDAYAEDFQLDGQPVSWLCPACARASILAAEGEVEE